MLESNLFIDLELKNDRIINLMSESINFTFAVPTERQAQGVKVMKVLDREMFCSKTCSSDKFEGGGRRKHSLLEIS